MTGRAVRLLRIGLTVSDLGRAAEFYREALGFAPSGEIRTCGAAEARLLGAEGARVDTLRLRLGAQEVELAAFDPPGRPYPPGSTAADLWFQHFAIVTADMAAAYDRLCRHGATPITEGGPQRLPEAAGGVTAYKFRDPDGHPLELIQFPPGTGDPAWQRAAPGTVTLGIDHSAISVADADRSIAFHAGLLGLSVGARQVNHGPAQERLDGLPGATVDVIALQPPDAPPHVELLGYRTPRGRPAPDPHPADIAAARLVFQAEDLPALALRLGGAASGPPAALADGWRGVHARDPDSHALLLLEPAP